MYSCLFSYFCFYFGFYFWFTSGFTSIFTSVLFLFLSLFYRSVIHPPCPAFLIFARRHENRSNAELNAETRHSRANALGMRSTETVGSGYRSAWIVLLRCNRFTRFSVNEHPTSLLAKSACNIFVCRAYIYYWLSLILVMIYFKRICSYRVSNRNTKINSALLEIG